MKKKFRELYEAAERKQPKVDLKIEDKMGVSKYMYEQIAGGYDNQLPLSSICDAHCFFCSNEMNPFEILREKFRDIEDVKKGITLLNPNAHAIAIGDALPGRISEGEALLHPKIFEILPLIRNYAPNSIIQVTTNATRLTEEFLIKLQPFRPIKFTISYQSNSEENWCKIFDSPARKFKIAQASFELIHKYGFMVEANMTPMPSMVGYEDIENTIKFLSSWPALSYLFIYAPGYSKFVPKEIKDALVYDTKEMSNFLTEMRKKYMIDINWRLDPERPLHFHPHKTMMDTYYQNFKNPLWLVSEAAHERASKIIEEFLPSVPNNHYVMNVKNRTYGGNIIAAGLLQVADFDKAIEIALKKKKDIDLLILPQIPFDKFGNDLTNINHETLYAKYEIAYLMAPDSGGIV